MVLFDMLTADAASKHGHEFSQRSTSPSASSSFSSNSRGGNVNTNLNQTNSQQQWLIPARLPFRVVQGLPYAARSPRTTQNHGHRGERVRRSMGGAAAVMGQLKEEPEEQEHEQEVPQVNGLTISTRVGLLFGSHSAAPRTEMSLENLRMPGAFHRTPPTPKRETTPTRDLPVEPLVIPPPLSTASVVEPFVTESPQSIAPETPIASRQTSIVENNQSSGSKREHRPKTRYEFAHPPPTRSGQPSKQPRVLAQMHQRRASGFHKPVYEIVPVSRIGPIQGGLKHKLKRLSRSGAKTIGAFATEDWAIMKVSQYASSTTGGNGKPDATTTFISDELSESQSLDSRDVLGVISLAPHTAGGAERKTQILVDNAVWDAVVSAEGVYDLKSVSTDVPCARWYVPKAQRASISGMEQSQATKLYFAPMHTDTRKHPTMGCITREHLDVYDNLTSTYTSDAEVLESEMLRRLIVISAFWVMACKGWSAHLNVPREEVQRPATSRSHSTIEKPRKLTKTTTLPCEESADRQSRSMSQTSALTKPVGRGIRSISLGRSLSVSAKGKSVDATTMLNERSLGGKSPFEEPIRTKSAEPRSSTLSDTPSKPATVEQDPTAQFRHLLSLSDSHSQSSSPSPSVRLDPPVSSSSSVSRRSPSLVESAASVAAERRGRRKVEVMLPVIASTSNEENEENEEERVHVAKRRTQSVHWTWRLPMPNLPSISNPVAGLFASQGLNVESKEDSEESGKVSVESASTAVNETPARESLTQNLVGIAGETEVKSESVSTSGVDDKSEIKDSKEKARSDPVPVMDLTSELPSIMSLHAELAATKQATPEEDSPPIRPLEEDGDSSDELELFGISSPDQYLKDFDRLQASWRSMTPQPWRQEQLNPPSGLAGASSSLPEDKDEITVIEEVMPLGATRRPPTPRSKLLSGFKWTMS